MIKFIWIFIVIVIVAGSYSLITYGSKNTLLSNNPISQIISPTNSNRSINIKNLSIGSSNWSKCRGDQPSIEVSFPTDWECTKSPNGQVKLILTEDKESFLLFEGIDKQFPDVNQIISTTDAYSVLYRKDNVSINNNGQIVGYQLNNSTSAPDLRLTVSINEQTPILATMHLNSKTLASKRSKAIIHQDTPKPLQITIQPSDEQLLKEYSFLLIEIINRLKLI